VEGAYQLNWHPRPEQIMAVSSKEDAPNDAREPRSKSIIRDVRGERTNKAQQMPAPKSIKHGLY
jgi:hypothetical protein